MANLEFLHSPRNHIDIEFSDLLYIVNRGKKDEKAILKHVSGKFRHGELTAIMGPSGAGKTTLLNILTEFQNEKIEGTIKRLASNKTESTLYKKESCYILQDDRLAPFFTVNETMRFAADLKLGPNASDSYKQSLIDEIIQTLGLLPCKFTLCHRISGGQRKRVSIALELIDNPSVMFLDEPTTGLDSSSSTQCVNMLQSLARGGRTIICTIHQPSSTIFDKLDNVYVMAAGQCVYQGPSIETVPFLSRFGLECPQYHNPADYLMEVANGDYGLKYRDILAKAVKEDVAQNISLAPSNELDQPKKNTTKIVPVNEWSKLPILLRRTLLQMHRSKMDTYFKAIIYAVLGLFVGLTYYGAGSDGSKSHSNLGFLGSSMLCAVYLSMMPSVLKFPAELAVLKKERFNNWYQLKTYYIAFVTIQIPIQIIFITIYITISYYFSGQLMSLDRFPKSLVIFVLLALVGFTKGILVGSLAEPVNGTFFSSIFLAVQICLAGFLIQFKHMPLPMYWASCIVYVGYAYEGLMHATAPKVILRVFGVENENYNFDLLFITGTFLVLLFAAFFALRWRLKVSL